jgi:hypothetical protein
VHVALKEVGIDQRPIVDDRVGPLRHFATCDVEPGEAEAGYVRQIRCVDLIDASLPREALVERCQLPKPYGRLQIGELEVVAEYWMKIVAASAAN